MELNEKTPRHRFPGTHSVQLGKTKGTRSKRRVKKTRGKIDAKWHVKAKEKVSVTSACDLGEACHLGLFLVHAVIAKGWHSSRGSRMHQVPSLLSVVQHGRPEVNSGACFAPRPGPAC